MGRRAELILKGPSLNHVTLRGVYETVTVHVIGMENVTKGGQDVQKEPISRNVFHGRPLRKKLESRKIFGVTDHSVPLQLKVYSRRRTC